MLHFYRKTIFLCICCVTAFVVFSSTYAKETKKEETVSNLFVPKEAITELAKDDLEKASAILQTKSQSDKSIYLLRELSHILLYKRANQPPSRADAYDFFKGIGVAYHNLYLFLKTQDIEQSDLFKQAIKYYKKSIRFASNLDKAEVYILMAAITESSGNSKKANSYFKKVKLYPASLDLQIQECLAAYFAAKKDVQHTVESLKKVYKGRSKTILNWIVLGDDFYFIKDDIRFQNMLKELDFDKKTKNPDLLVPQRKKLKINYKKPRVRLKNTR